MNDILTDDTDTGDNVNSATKTFEPGLNLKTASQMTPKKFAQSVLQVYERLGGASWLFTEAQIDPKTFLGMLTKLIPKSLALDDLAGISVELIDQFGKTIRINKSEACGARPGEIDACEAKSGEIENVTGSGVVSLPEVIIDGE